MRLANPGTTLGSKISEAVPRSAAASMAGPEAYPPTPTTTSGLNPVMMPQAAAMA